MYKLEHEKGDKDKSTDAAPRINQLSNIQDRVKDDWLANRFLRDQFRARKKERKAKSHPSSANKREISSPGLLSSKKAKKEQNKEKEQHEKRKGNLTRWWFKAN